MFNELRTLIKHASVYGTSELLRKGIGFVMIPIYTRYLVPSEYGLLELVDLTLTVTAILLGLGLGSSVIRYYHNFEDPRDKQEVFTTVLTFAVILSILACVGLEIASGPISQLVSGDPQSVKYFRLVFVAFAIQNIYLVSEGFLLARKESVLYSALSTGTLISNLSLNILFLVVMRLGVLGILLSMLITKALNAIVVCAITLRHIHYSFSWTKLKKILAFGLPLMPATIGLFVIHFSDRFFVQKYCNLAEVGIYSLGYKFGMLLSIIVSAPIFRIWDTQRFEIAKTDNGKRVAGRIFTFYCGVLVFSSLTVCVFVDEIIGLVAGPEFQRAASVTPLIILSYILFGMANFCSLGIMITNKTKYAACIQIVVAGVNVVLNMLLIRDYGIVGAAAATVLSFLLLLVFNFIVSQRLYPVLFEYRRLSILFVLALAVFGASKLLEVPLLIALVIKSLLILGFPFVLFTGGFFYPEEIIRGREWLKNVTTHLRAAKI